MHILFFDYKSYIKHDLLLTFDQLHIKYTCFEYCFTDKNNDDEFLAKFDKMLEDGAFDAVFSVNYYPLLAVGCYKKNLKYISWSYDCPLNVRNIEETLGLSTNYVFLYDRMQVEKYSSLGFDHIYHLPLAVNINRLNRFTDAYKYSSQLGGDIAFVGNLYDYVYGQLTSILPEYLQGYLDGICESQINVYGCYFIDQLITEDFMRDINLIYRTKYPDGRFQLIKEELTYAMAAQITFNERTRILSSLCDLGYKVNLFSNDKFNHPRLNHPGSVSYTDVMPYVFKTNKINLNMSLKCIPSGIPLRVLDIIGCKSFLLTNYQPELMEYFTPGENIVMYSSIDESMELANYYLKNEQERMRIASKGYEIAVKNFDYIDRLKHIFHLTNLL